MTDLACIATSRRWRNGVVVDDHVTIEEIAETVDDHATLLWVDLLRPNEEELHTLAATLKLGATAVEDALGQQERPKVTRYDTHLFFTTDATRLVAAQASNPGWLQRSRISGFILPNALVTIRLDDRFDIGEVVNLWQDNASLLRHGATALVHGLLDVIVDGHFDTIQRLDEELEGLEDELFAEEQDEDEPSLRSRLPILFQGKQRSRRRKDRDFLIRIYGLRKDLVELRRVVLPMREVVNGLLRHRGVRLSTHNDGTPSDIDNWLDDLYDHVLRAAEWTESLRDMVGSIFETNLSLQDARLNSIMKQLAAWAAIIAVPTAITGWFGQNVPYWGFQTAHGVWLSVGLIVAMSVFLYVVFRRRDWL